MDSINDTEQAVPHEAAKLITCVLNSEKVEKVVLHALYKERQITRANSINCRGFASLFEAKTEADDLPRPHFARLIEVIVPEAEADEVFDFIYQKAGLDKPGAGVVFMATLLGASSFSLPRDVREED
jgi:nitrogen regulatory protein PII